ncbi:glycosyltransferase family 8 protein [Gilliamella sp. ESL0443]|uniref:glycosyltransferase family 8 protein n=1 Tax=Gilliamella sp. ESL0443 TaxID=2704655 RepID=UPI001C6A0FA9|nr:glycosyltransferase [Gilliamella sp. ESL0443]QYN42413.1 glycosyltransferase family 8 protein [Gilliamella sp. ESL0443]
MKENLFIKKISTLFENAQASLETTHIAFCFDDNYAMPAGIAMSSVISNNMDKNLVFHLFANNVTNEKISMFNQLNNDNVSIICYEIGDDFSINPDTLVLHVSASTCLRFVVPQILNKVTSRVLYLDCDVLCTNNLNELIHTDLSDKYAAVVPDVDKTQEKQCPACDIPYGEYFNAGMIYINTDMWVDNNLTDKAFAMINSGKVYKFADQDVLNILMQGKTVFLPKIYNQLTSLTVGGNEDNLLSEDTVIIHYVTGNKPWYQLYLTPLYQTYIASSPWANQKLSLANENAPSTTRRYAKLLASQKKYFSAFKYYLLYLKHKVTKKR